MPLVLRADVIAGDQDALLHVAARTPADLHRLVPGVEARGRGAGHDDAAAAGDQAAGADSVATF